MVQKTAKQMFNKSYLYLFSIAVGLCAYAPLYAQSLNSNQQEIEIEEIEAPEQGSDDLFEETETNDTDIKSLFEDDNLEEKKASFEDTFKKLEMKPMTGVRLRALDKITGRTQTFNASIDEVLKFGSLFIRPRACNQSLPTEKPESASFLQVWEDTPEEEPTWIFSNWMFASSPALSAMEHPIYDIWVISCIKTETSSSSEE